MQIGALGDIHGAFDAVADIMARHSDVTLWVQVGDMASNEGEDFTPAQPVYWINRGATEDFDIVASAMAGQPPAPTLHYLPNGGPHVVGPWRVAASAARSRRAGITRRCRCCRPRAASASAAPR